MNIHYLQHVSYETPAAILPIIANRGHALTSTKFFRNDTLPDLEAIDMLIVMGGPMGIHDTVEFPWLLPEKEFIKAAILSGKTILGVCLGAQLIADALDAKVYPNPCKEIGWFPIMRHHSVTQTPLFDIFPERMTVFHWHGDTFALPQGSVPLASSSACKNQGFMYSDRVIALQFHIETTSVSLNQLINNSLAEVKSPEEYIQSPTEMREKAGQHFSTNNNVLKKLWLHLEHTAHNKINLKGN